MPPRTLLTSQQHMWQGGHCKQAVAQECSARVAYAIWAYGTTHRYCRQTVAKKCFAGRGQLVLLLTQLSERTQHPVVCTHAHTYMTAMR